MNTYWAFVRTGTGSFIKVYVNADNAYVAKEMLIGMYGDDLMTGAAQC